jgi:tRNA(Ile)-lysidine synthase
VDCWSSACCPRVPLLNALLQKIRRSIRRYHLLPPGSSVLIGLSGGSDSVALTLLLQELSRHADFRVAALAHLNHQIRPAAAADEAFCRAFASRRGLPILVESVDVPGYAAAQRLSLEDAGRRLRYDFLHRAAAQFGADVVAVGHTENDQAETFLLKLARGAGLIGLGAIYPRRDTVVRPLIDVSRADLREFLRGRGEGWVEDDTNDDLDNPRNRIRHRVLPELDLAYGGPSRRGIARAAGLLREDAGWIEEVANDRYTDLCAVVAGGVTIDAVGLIAEPLPIRRRVLLRALRSVSGGREVGLDHIDAALEVASGQTAAVDLPGARLELKLGKLVLLQQDAHSK